MVKITNYRLLKVITFCLGSVWLIDCKNDVPVDPLSTADGIYYGSMNDTTYISFAKAVVATQSFDGKLQVSSIQIIIPTLNSPSDLFVDLKPVTSQFGSLTFAYGGKSRTSRQYGGNIVIRNKKLNIDGVIIHSPRSGIGFHFEGIMN